jgi:magnesium chelatase family protein
VLAKVLSCAIVGLDGALVEVEVDISTSVSSFTIVGLPDTAVQEARERVRAAVRNSGLQFPSARRITVNLAPADLRKEGPAYDLPIAVGILIASQQVAIDVSRALFLGELSLDGALRHTHGILSMVALARELGLDAVYVPEDDAEEAALIDGVTVYPVSTLAQLAAHLQGMARIAPFDRSQQKPPAPPAWDGVDFSAIRGQEHVKRALEVAAAGAHNVLLVGPPGAGKTLLARSLPSILPPMTTDEALEVTKIYSVAGLLPTDHPLMSERPFRAPHHTVSHAGLVGGGRQPRPGEISLSHRGVLFLDELPEFGQNVLKVLRQPIEDRRVTISRAHGSITFPANVMLVAAMNPCPCGYFGDPVRSCTCAPSTVTKYQRRISGPLLDRIDIFIEAPRVEYDKLSAETPAEPSAAVRERVVAARQRQRERFAGSRVSANAEMTPVEVRAYCQEFLDAPARELVRVAMSQLALSARAFHRVLKLARTIADLAGSESIGAAHVAEALQYRQRTAV